MIYLDACALVKLVRTEEHSVALSAFLSSTTTAVVSSELARAEVHRALWRNQEEKAAHAAADRLLTRIATLALSTIVDAAGALPYPHLRSLDALHLATAQRLGTRLAAFVTYDKQLLTAARKVHLPVATPGERLE